MSRSTVSASALDTELVEKMLRDRQVMLGIIGGAALCAIIYAIFMLVVGAPALLTTSSCIAAVGLSMWSVCEFCDINSIIQRRQEAAGN